MDHAVSGCKAAGNGVLHAGLAGEVDKKVTRQRTKLLTARTGWPYTAPPTPTAGPLRRGGAEGVGESEARVIRVGFFEN